MSEKLPWGVHTLRSMFVKGAQTETRNGYWVRSVALPYDGNRLVAAWWVLTGKAYALRWPMAGELEDALENRSAS